MRYIRWFCRSCGDLSEEKTLKCQCGDKMVEIKSSNLDVINAYVEKIWRRIKMNTFEAYSPCVHMGPIKCLDCPKLDGCDLVHARNINKKAFEADVKTAGNGILAFVPNEVQGGSRDARDLLPPPRQHVIQAIMDEPELPEDMPDALKQAFGGNTNLITRALRATASITKRNILKRIQQLKAVPPLKIEVYQHDWTPGFAAFNDDGSIQEGATAHISIDLGGFLASLEAKDLEKEDLPYVIAESIMHEIMHSLESWAGKEFNEEKIEALLEKYREKYKNSPPPEPE